MAGKNPKRRSTTPCEPEALNAPPAPPEASGEAAPPEAKREPRRRPSKSPPRSPPPRLRTPVDGNGETPEKPQKEVKKAPKAKPVVIVEAPAQAKTINKILGTGFVVKACMGTSGTSPSGRGSKSRTTSSRPTRPSKGKTKIVSS